MTEAKDPGFVRSLGEIPRVQSFIEGRTFWDPGVDQRLRARAVARRRVGAQQKHPHRQGLVWATAPPPTRGCCAEQLLPRELDPMLGGAPLRPRRRWALLSGAFMWVLWPYIVVQLVATFAPEALLGARASAHPAAPECPALVCKACAAAPSCAARPPCAVAPSCAARPPCAAAPLCAACAAAPSCAPAPTCAAVALGRSPTLHPEVVGTMWDANKFTGLGGHSILPPAFRNPTLLVFTGGRLVSMSVRARARRVGGG